jgi:hypothetical protein
MPESIIIPGNPSPENDDLALGQARHWAYKCDVCGHVWLARKKNQPRRCASAKCKSSKWNHVIAARTMVVRFRAGRKVVESPL